MFQFEKEFLSQKRSGENADLKMMKDLEGAHAVIAFVGKDEIIAAANQFKGKFLRLFQKGWNIYNEKFGKL